MACLYITSQECSPICVDPKSLNKSVLPETHPIPKVDDTLAQLTGAAFFTKLDANSGFWQIPLSDVSKVLTTFITPFGRYALNKLPFGILSAPDLFQKTTSKILEGLDGVVCLSKIERGSRVYSSCQCHSQPSKCEFHKSSAKFLGHVIDHHSI